MAHRDPARQHEALRRLILDLQDCLSAIERCRKPVLAAIAARGVARATVTLHVGAGTFLPLRSDDPRAHRLHAEWGEVSAEAIGLIAMRTTMS